MLALLLMTVGLSAQALDVRIPDTQHCEKQALTIPKSPLPSTAVKKFVLDRDNNGQLNAAEINYAITTASSEYAVSARPVVLDLSAHSHIVLEQSIWVRSGVYLFSNAPTKTYISNVRTGYASPMLVRLQGENLGLIGFHLRTNLDGIQDNYRSLVRIQENSKKVFILNNTLVHENTLDTRSEAGNLDLVAAVDLDNNNENVYIDGNTIFHTSLGVRSKDRSVSNVFVRRNTISKWRAKAIFFSAGFDRSGVARIPRKIFIDQNLILPAKLGEAKQPINVTSTFTVGAEASALSPVDINVRFNKIVSSGIPHIRDVESTGTADNISLHQTDTFQIRGNCVYNSGELGINASFYCRNGVISENLVVGADMPGINIGKRDQPQRAEKIVIRDNVIINSGRDRSDQFVNRDHARSGIFLVSAQDVTINGNRIEDLKANGEVATSPQIANGIYHYRSANITITSTNSFKLAPGAKIVNTNDPSDDF
jgi:hypothetical protein